MLKQIRRVEQLYPQVLAVQHQTDEHYPSRQLLEGTRACRSLTSDDWQQFLDSGVGPGIFTGQGEA